MVSWWNCGHMNQKQTASCQFPPLLCACSLQVDPSLFCVYGRQVRSAASMAALTFSLASSEAERVPLASTDQPRNKRALSLQDGLVWDVLPLPLATHKTVLVSPSSPVCMWELLHPQLIPLADSGSGPRAASQPVTLRRRARQTQARHGKHLTPVCAWEHLALSDRTLSLSDGQSTHCVHTYQCYHSTRLLTSITIPL